MTAAHARLIVRALNCAHMEPDEPLDQILKDCTLIDLVQAAAVVSANNSSIPSSSAVTVPSEARIARFYLLTHERTRIEPIAHLGGKALYVRDFVSAELEGA